MSAKTTSLDTVARQQSLIGAATPLLERRWRRPTFGEFVERLALEFGITPAGSGLYLMGLGPDERLAPEDIQTLCAQLGLPAEDFGVEP